MKQHLLIDFLPETNKKWAHEIYIKKFQLHKENQTINIFLDIDFIDLFEEVLAECNCFYPQFTTFILPYSDTKTMDITFLEQIKNCILCSLKNINDDTHKYLSNSSILHKDDNFVFEIENDFSLHMLKSKGFNVKINKVCSVSCPNFKGIDFVSIEPKEEFVAANVEITKAKESDTKESTIKIESSPSKADEDIIPQPKKGRLLYGKRKTAESMPIKELLNCKCSEKKAKEYYTTEGVVYSTEKIKTERSLILKILITDFEKSIESTVFLQKSQLETAKKIKKGDRLLVTGSLKMDDFTGRKNLAITTIESIKNAETDDKQDLSSLCFGLPFFEDSIDMNTAHMMSQPFAVTGEIIGSEMITTRTGNYVCTIHITDHSTSLTCKTFLKKDLHSSMTEAIDHGYVQVYGVYKEEEKNINIYSVKKAKKHKKTDDAPKKRVELHAHTKFSALDAVIDPKDLIKKVADYNHSAIAITDHGVLQAFPSIIKALKGKDIKPIYGIEAYLIDDTKPLILNCDDTPLNGEFVVFDLETTGLSPRCDYMIEIGAAKIKNYKVTETFQTYVKPQKPIPHEIEKLTNIHAKTVENAPGEKDALLEFLKFADNLPLVAHNAEFDLSFIRMACRRCGIDELTVPVIDTLTLSQDLLMDKIARFNLGRLAKYFHVRNANYHRADNDACVTAEILFKLFDMLKEQNISTLSEINAHFKQRKNHKAIRSSHAVILAKNKSGLHDLYRLVSEAHINYYYKNPRIPKSLLSAYRENLLISSACEAGEVYTAILKKQTEKRIDELVEYYDYLELQPLGNNAFHVREGNVKDEAELIEINKEVMAYADKHNKLVVATGDIHFLNPKDSIFRAILQSGNDYSDADLQPPLYYRTTQEMLDEFDYLGDRAEEIVIDNTNIIADSIEIYPLLPDGLIAPKIDGAEEDLKKLTYEGAKRIYGENLPAPIKERMEYELNSIINNDYAVLYIMAQKLVHKSNSDGYLVGSRGSVGSSVVAYFCGITEVNSFPPHYYCKNCHYFEMDSYEAQTGIDLPPKNCPDCGEPLVGAGFNIDFAIFMGFDGDKVPDIDLNFSGEYQSKAHDYVEELLGSDKVFRAGTISTIAEKTAYGYVKKYFEKKNKELNNAEAVRLAKGLTDIKRTTGQHPGGLIVLPHDREIYEFTAIQHPADDKTKNTITTHYNFKFIHDTLVKLDILGHDDPTIIKMLGNLSGLDMQAIPLNDPATMKIFSTTEGLGLEDFDILTSVATYGVPEFGTAFVRQMLEDTRPNTFDELVRISGLSHGTNVWLNNAQILVHNKTATLKEVICTRDDILKTLIDYGLAPLTAFEAMELVRKGIPNSIPESFDEYEAQIKTLDNLPDWFIDSCRAIGYMFPKAHACAYVIMAYRIAYCKVHHPLAYYATFFSIRAKDFDIDMMMRDKYQIRDRIIKLSEMGNDISKKDSDILTSLEVALEMAARGYKILPIDLYKSEAVNFIIEDGCIRAPFASLSGVAENAGLSIVKARNEKEFISIEDLQKRGGINKTVIEALKNHGTLHGLPETSQVSIFDLFE